MKTTKRHFKIFKDEVHRLLKLWNCPPWDIAFEHVPLGSKDASCLFNAESRKATISFNSQRSNQSIRPSSDANARANARHEAIHILLAPVTWPAEQRWMTWETFIAGEHAVVEHLMELLPR